MMTPDQALAAAIRRNPHLVPKPAQLTPIEEMISREDALPGEEHAIRTEGISAWLEWIFEAGPDLLEASKRLYAYVRSYRPDLLHCMSGEEIASLMGQTRAAESARVDRVIGQTLKDAGCSHTALPFQKSASARQKYAEAAKGNHNRARGKRAA